MIIPGVLNGGLTLIGPAADGSDGQFLKTNGAGVLSFDDAGGSSGPDWVPNYTLPVNGDFSWVNQDSASIDTSVADRIIIGHATYSTGLNVNARVKSAPSTPYTITAALMSSVAYGGIGYAGLCFRQSSDGKMQLFGFSPSNGGSLYTVSRKMTDAINYSADYSLDEMAGRLQSGRLVFLRLADNGTNRICSFSSDGVTFQTYHTIGRTDFLTANQVGFYINAYSAQTYLTLLSWTQA